MGADTLLCARSIDIRCFSYKEQHGTLRQGPLPRLRPRMRPRMRVGPLRGLGPAASLQRYHVLWSPSYLVGGVPAHLWLSRRARRGQTTRVRVRGFRKAPKRVVMGKWRPRNDHEEWSIPPMDGRRSGILVSERLILVAGLRGPASGAGSRRP